MRAYDFSIHNKTVKRDKSRYFTYIFILLLVVAAGAFVYYVVLNSPRILYYFRENKYSEIERAHTEALKAIQNLSRQNSNKNAFVQEIPAEVEDFLTLAHTLQKDHGDDPILFYHEASVLNELVRRSVADTPQALVELLFRDFVAKPKFPKEIDEKVWQQALLTGRRALALGLPAAMAQKLYESQLDVYLLGSRPWWQSAEEAALLAPAVKKMPAWHLMQAGLVKEPPDFDLLKASYGASVATYAKSVYYLRSGNSPLGVSSLRELAKNSADAFAKDIALYTLGSLSGRDKRIRDQLTYYKEIRFQEFAPEFPFFVPEYHYLLRFLGSKSEADQLMKTWEEMKAQAKE